jgi:GNAT superfamily N-acetyltransferase
MPQELLYSLILPDSKKNWNCFCRLYQSEFPTWEQEPLDAISERLRDGRYVLTGVWIPDGQLVGFYLLDLPKDPDYSILTFMAVTPEYRNQGLGSEICRHAFQHYTEREHHWLLIEAAERQSSFYGRLGARCLELEYHIPHFGDAESGTPMYLMVLMKPAIPDEMDGDFLRRIIEHIFIEGYRVTREDPCLQRQIELIPSKVRTQEWPPEQH